MNTTQAPICMCKEFWVNTQLSIARRYGGARIDGHEYHIIGGNDMVRKDFIPFYRKLGREKFLEILKAYQQTPDKELLAIYKEMTSKKKKEEPKPLDLFGEYNAPSNKYCKTCIHRKRYELNDHSTKVVQCCELISSSRSNSGYKTIKVTDLACNKYEEDKK